MSKELYQDYINGLSISELANKYKISKTRVYKDIAEYSKKQEIYKGGRLPNKEILYLKQSIEQCNDKPIFYVSRIYGNKYIIPQKQFDDLTNENVKYKRMLEIIKNKNVRIYWIKSYSCVESYNNGLPPKEQLTQEEFNTLKEWMK